MLTSKLRVLSQQYFLLASAAQGMLSYIAVYKLNLCDFNSCVAVWQRVFQ